MTQATSSRSAFFLPTLSNRLFILLLLLMTNQAQAKTIQLLDQNQQPIQNAVISFKDGTVSSNTANTDKPIAIMDQVKKRFVPRVLIIEKGQKVSFPNSDNIRHHVFSFSSPKMFEIKLYKDQPVPPVMFEQSGLVVVGCNIHDRMVGYIYVKDQEQAILVDATGKAEVPDSISQISIWHEELSKQGQSRQIFELDDSALQPIELSLAVAKPTPNSSFSGTKGFGK